MSGTIDRRGATPPDFLVKLLTMVGDEAPDLISWTGGKLYIHDPVALERKMSVYFRHSNFSSFQRQLNNFGFRKVEGKGKLAPCMYMHDDLVGRSVTQRGKALQCGSYAIDARRLHQTRPRVVSFLILRRFGHHRRGASERERAGSRRWRLDETASPRRRRRDHTRVNIGKMASSRCRQRVYVSRETLSFDTGRQEGQDPRGFQGDKSAVIPVRAGSQGRAPQGPGLMSRHADLWLVVGRS